MYYSIPTLRRAALLHKDCDATTSQVQASSGQSSKDTDDATHGDLYIVKRQSRVSTECHPDCVFREYFESNVNGDDTDCKDDSDDEEDFLMAVIAAKASLASSV